MRRVPLCAVIVRKTTPPVAPPRPVLYSSHRPILRPFMGQWFHLKPKGASWLVRLDRTNKLSVKIQKKMLRWFVFYAGLTEVTCDKTSDKKVVLLAR